ncbi:MAG: RAD55 family ATPase [Gemmatimonadota bacterium]
MRGAAPLPGLHGLTLDAAGVTVHPSPETRVAEDAGAGGRAPTPAPGRASTGLAELDALLGGGLPRHSQTLVVGRLGTGKTLLGLCFALAGARAGEPTVFLGFRESAAQLAEKAAHFALGAELRAALAPGGGLTLLRLPPVNQDPDALADRLLAAVDGAGARRLVVDSVAELERAVATSGDPGRVDDYLAALVELLRARAVTTLFIRDVRQTVAAEIDFGEEPLAVFTENLVLLRQVAHRGRLRRVLAVLKMGASAHDTSLREFTIRAPEGIRVLAPFESGAGVLADLAADDATDDA